MRDFITKRDNDDTARGVVTAAEFNDLFDELENAVRVYKELDANDKTQLATVMDRSSKAIYYYDYGSENIVKLRRRSTTQKIETLFSGFTMVFVPSYDNTGETTIEVQSLGAKPALMLSKPLVAGDLKKGALYVAVYADSNDSFWIYPVSTGRSPSTFVYNNAGKIVDANGKELVSQSSGGSGTPSPGIDPASFNSLKTQVQSLTDRLASLASGHGDVDLTNFTSYHTAGVSSINSGWQKFPNKFIIQYGGHEVPANRSSTDLVINFPISFAHGVEYLGGDIRVESYALSAAEKTAEDVIIWANPSNKYVRLHIRHVNAVQYGRVFYWVAMGHIY